MTSEELRKLRDSSEIERLTKEHEDIIANLDKTLINAAKQGRKEVSVYEAHAKRHWWYKRPANLEDPSWKILLRLKNMLTEDGIKTEIRGPWINTWYLVAIW